MTSLMSMEDLFYGPTEATWILPTREDEALRRYRDQRELSPPRRFLKPEAPVVRFDPREMALQQPQRVRFDPRDELRPVMPRPQPRELRPIERLARVHTVPEPVPVMEEIRKVVEVPVPTPVAPPTQVIVPAPPAQAVAPPVKVVQRSVSPPRSIIHHPIEMKVPMCCDKCAKKVKERLQGLEGVEDVVTDQFNQKVIVYGRVDPARALNRVRLVKKRSVFWDMTVDYSENYRRARQVEVEAVARESAKRAEVVNQQQQQKAALVAPVAPPTQVVVNLPEEHRGAPKMTAILPAQKPERIMPFVADQPRVHHQRFVSPPRAYRQELHHGPAPHEMMRRQPEFYNRRPAPVY